MHASPTLCPWHVPLAATCDVELQRALELQCRLQQGPHLYASGPLPQSRQPLPPCDLAPSQVPAHQHVVSGRLGSSQLTWRYWAAPGSSHARSRSGRAAETPLSTGGPAACPSAPPLCSQRDNHVRLSPSASGTKGSRSTAAAAPAATIASATPDGSTLCACAAGGPPAASRYSIPGWAQAQATAQQPEHLHLLGEVQVATPSRCGPTTTSRCSTGGGGGSDRCPGSGGSGRGVGAGGSQRRSRSLLQLVPALSQSLSDDGQGLLRLQQQLYTVASPFASAAAAALVDEGGEVEGEAITQRQRGSPPLQPGGPAGSAGHHVVEPPIIAAYSCAASLSPVLLDEEGDCCCGEQASGSAYTGYGWLYSSDDEDGYPSRATTARSPCFPSPPHKANINPAMRRATPPRATSSSSTAGCGVGGGGGGSSRGTGGQDLAAPRAVQSPVLCPAPAAAADSRSKAAQGDEHHTLSQQPQHVAGRRRHRVSAPGRASWYGWRARPLPQPVPEDPQGSDEHTRSYRQQAAATLSVLSPPDGVRAAANAVTAAAGGSRPQRASAGGSGGTAVAVTPPVSAVVRNLSAPILHASLAPAAQAQDVQAFTGGAGSSSSGLLALLGIWS
ncbi:hypothetical protein HYH02_013981 [Chlamydomonas schloesseri]|uniref:Uncharacterized protein n=1 Tax=Chlamydomonas schloesseri TaxID=2026947 RepID=A0A835SWV0_9CHLO|nr:hypothetical protein HYH02_013981 [Chlamydomonas schloesseri]|eukprot:KAG2429724.1 hypothetical protein HYH02_013981 [Chlamydomonas schloesseri]